MAPDRERAKENENPADSEKKITNAENNAGKASRLLDQIFAIFESINEIIYISDPFTYEILYCNKVLKERFGKDPTGGICYKEFQGRDSPCDFCTNHIILKNPGQPYYWEYHNPILNRDYYIVDLIIM